MNENIALCVLQRQTKRTQRCTERCCFPRNSPHTWVFCWIFTQKSKHGKILCWHPSRDQMYSELPPSLGTHSLSMYGVLWWLIVATQTRDSSHFNYDCVTLCNNSHPLFVIRTILKVRSMFSARHHQTCGSCHQTNNKSGNLETNVSTSARGQRLDPNDRIHGPNEQVFPDITDIMHTGIVCESE